MHQGLLPEVSILVPVHNEEAVLPAFLQRIRHFQEAHRHHACEWIFIDDGSTDRTLDLLHDHVPHIQVLRLPLRSGMGRALKLGMGMARGDYMVWLDGDGTYDLNDLSRLLYRRHEADQVIGCRHWDHGMLGPVRFTIKRLVGLWASLLLGHWIPDHNCGLRVLRRAAVDRWFNMLPNGFCSTTATVAALAAGQKVVFEPISYGARPRGSRSKFNPLKDGWHVLRQIHKVWHRRHGLRG